MFLVVYAWIFTYLLTVLCTLYTTMGTLGLCIHVCVRAPACIHVYLPACVHVCAWCICIPVCMRDFTLSKLCSSCTKSMVSVLLQTLHDLMDESELESLGPSDANTAVSTADRKRRNLKENMRREAEERQKKKKELLLREREYEKVRKCTLKKVI